MLRSMYAGVSGLKAHMNKMDIVGNNIANVNTTGYKGSRATFKTMLNQTIQGASAPQDERGGTNPQQIGLGVSLGSIDKDMSQGNLKSTGKNTDLAIQGNGFFVLNGGGSNLYTRAGSLTFDKEGYLVNSTNGYRIQGWQADASGNIDTNGKLQDLTLDENMSANATDQIDYTGKLDADSSTGDTRITTIDVFDSQGTSHTIELEFSKTATSNEWNYEVTDISGMDDSAPANTELNLADGTTNQDTNPDGEPDLGLGTITFDASGEIDTIDGQPVSGASNPTLNFTPSGGGDIPNPIELDFTELKQYSGAMTAEINNVNGYKAGSLNKFSIGQSGVITGHYDNGKRQIVGQVAIADFNNPAGLNAEGDTMFRESNNSGQAKISTPNSGGLGALKAGTLEMSNIDLSKQFTEMITTQRGFQANSKTISTSDQILNELVNLKR